MSPPKPRAKTKVDPALLKVKAEFDTLMELYGNDTYEEIDISNLRDEERDEERVVGEETELWEFYFFQDSIEEDFTNLNAEFTTLEFTTNGFLFNQTDSDTSNEELTRLFDMFRDVAEDQAKSVEVVATPKPVGAKDLAPLKRLFYMKKDEFQTRL